MAVESTAARNSSNCNPLTSLRRAGPSQGLMSCNKSDLIFLWGSRFGEWIPGTEKKYTKYEAE